MVRLGTKHTLEAKEKMSRNRKGKYIGRNHHFYGKRPPFTKEGVEHYLWKGDGVGYKGLHQWLRRNLTKPALCTICNVVQPTQVANIRPDKNPETYTRDLTNWRWVCYKCHVISDGRLQKIKQTNIPPTRDPLTGRFLRRDGKEL